MAEVPAPEIAPEAAPEAAAAVEKEAPKTPTRVQPPREVKTKEYRDAHRVSWSYHPRHLPKDTNQYHRIVQSAAIKMYNDGINVTAPRLTEAVKARATAGARNIRFVLLAHELFDLAQRKKSSNKTLVSASCGCRQQQTQGARAGQRQEADRERALEDGLEAPPCARGRGGQEEEGVQGKGKDKGEDGPKRGQEGHACGSEKEPQADAKGRGCRRKRQRRGPLCLCSRRA